MSSSISTFARAMLSAWGSCRPCSKSATTVILYVLDEHPGEELRALVEQAVTSCPTQAISIVEE